MVAFYEMFIYQAFNDFTLSIKHLLRVLGKSEFDISIQTR